jgi:tRNA dimethylallyltransferase
MGPTGVGKTDLAMDLYEQIPIEIISVDSVQIYKKLDIGSGKPSKDVLKAFPHEMIDILECSESYSTAKFQTDCLACIKKAFDANKIPVLVGGSMMYFHHLVNGLSRLPSVSDEIRYKVQKEFEEKGSKEMHQYLKEIDIDASLKIHENDSQRIKRAIEVFKETGKQFSQWQVEQKREIDKLISSSNLQQIAIKPTDKEIHREVVGKRFKDMIEKGLIEEVEKILDHKNISRNSQSMKSVGYRQVCDFLEGDIDLDDMIEKGMNATRQLAKRQMTWINNWKDLIILEKNAELLASVKSIIEKN